MKIKIIVILIILVGANCFSTFLLFASNNEVGYQQIIGELEKNYKKVNDYSCSFYKKEYIEGEYILRNNIYLKYKKPNFYFLRWTEGKKQGMEAIYAGEKYNNKIKVHLPGIMGLINLSLDPWGKTAMKGCRHSILESDFGYMISMLRKNCEKAQKSSKFKIEFLGNHNIDGIKSHFYKFTFPDEKNYYGKIIKLYVYENIGLPIKFIVYDDKRLIEEYKFLNLKINNGFTTKDFDVDNPDYEF
jgi:outer membrane lipoprotein-sorting protein